MDTAHTRRFQANAQADPDAYAAYVRQRLGMDPAHAEAVLRIVGKLQHFEDLGTADIRALRAANPSAPAGAVEAAVEAIRQTHPGQRADHAMALLAGDAGFLQSQDYHQRSDATRELMKLQANFHTLDMAEQINAKREATAAADRLAPKVDLDKHRVKPDGLSTRELIERQMQPKGAAEFKQAVEMDPNSEEHWTARHRAADRLEASDAVLESGEASTREALASAWDREVIADWGRDIGAIAPAED